MSSEEEQYLTCACEKCGNSIAFPAHGVGVVIECPHCSQETVLSAPVPEPAPSPPPPPPKPPAPPPTTRPPASSSAPSRGPSGAPPGKPPGGKPSGPSGRGLHRYSAQGMAKPINFYYSSAEARSVSVVGEFNNWSPEVHPMKRQPDGNWLAQIELNHGHHAYMFMVDGKMTLDPRATGITRNEKGERVSLIGVS